MPIQLLTISNYALAQVKEMPISQTDFDGGTEWHHLLLREAVQDILKRMYRAKKEGLFKSTFDITTTASQATYSFNFNTDFLADTQLRFIDSGTNDYFLNYLTENEALNRYIDFANLTLEGKPSEWWIQTTNTAGVLQLRLNPVPDNIYTIRGFKYADYSRATATTTTSCTQWGDTAIQSYLEFRLANQLQASNVADFKEKADQDWRAYLGENIHQEDVSTYVFPYQHY